MLEAYWSSKNPSNLNHENHLQHFTTTFCGHLNHRLITLANWALPCRWRTCSKKSIRKCFFSKPTSNQADLSQLGPPLQVKNMFKKKHQEVFFFQTHLKPSWSYSQTQVINSCHQFLASLNGLPMTYRTVQPSPQRFQFTPKLRRHKFDQRLSHCHQFPCLPQLWLQHLSETRGLPGGPWVTWGDHLLIKFCITYN